MAKKVVDSQAPEQSDTVEQAHAYRPAPNAYRTSPGPAPAGKPILGPGPKPSGPRVRNRI